MRREPLNANWGFHLGNPPKEHWQQPENVNWRQVDLPHDWSIELERAPENPSGTSGGFFPMGNGWYRKSFTAPEVWAGKKVYVEFEGIYMNAELWLNENFLLRHPYGYTSFLVDLTPYLEIGGTNALTVSVDNSCQLNSRWYSGSGIYRPAWLWIAEPIHISHWGTYITTPEVSSEAATVRVRTMVNNETQDAQEVSLHLAVTAPDGSSVAHGEVSAKILEMSQQEITLDLAVGQPQLWSPETPALYTLHSELRQGDRTLDDDTTTFGIRTLHYSAEKGFLLNGEPTLLKGGCVHHDNGVLGAASYPRSEERKVELLKASGYNAVRCAHNPPAPAFLEACDRLGMLVIDEAFDCWRQGKNPYDYHVVFDDWWQRDVASMVMRDRNHPSIIMWSIGNEILERDGRSQGDKVAWALADHVRALDPTRPVTAAICGLWDKKRTWEDTDAVFAALGVGGYNYQWRQYQPDHERQPERVMAGNESTAGEAWESWTSVEDLSYVIGDFVWTAWDYLGESGIGRVHFDGEDAPFLGDYPWHQANCGDLDLCGFKRPQSYYRDALWGNPQALYIAVHDPIPEGKTPKITYWGWPEVWHNWTWPGHEGETFKVDVYASCERVELFLNGVSQGVKPTTREDRYCASFEVPYAPGELKAVGWTNNTIVSEFRIETVTEPTHLRLTPDRTALRAKAGDLCFITAEVVDAAGRVHPTADPPIFFTIQGEGRIAAVGNGNPTSEEPYRGNRRSAHRGRCLVVVASNGKPGSIRLQAHADGLEGTEVIIEVTD